MKQILLSIFLLALTSCTGAVIIPSIVVFGMHQEAVTNDNKVSSPNFINPSHPYSNFDNANTELELKRLREEWNSKYNEIGQ
jgi:hypothetical protein